MGQRRCGQSTATESQRVRTEFHNEREFKSITTFQYALWVLDWYMLGMMIV